MANLNLVLTATYFGTGDTGHAIFGSFLDGSQAKGFLRDRECFASEGQANFGDALAWDRVETCTKSGRLFGLWDSFVEFCNLGWFSDDLAHSTGVIRRGEQEEKDLGFSQGLFRCR